MNISGTTEPDQVDDAGLVAKSLGGNREAFCQIVERYQGLISSLAYCATGDFSQSEDLAQETFVSAWRQLPQLREPAKLRPWLCSIARFLVSKSLRRESREPVHAAKSLEAVEKWISPEPLPAEHIISEEEKAILWRALERLPEIYREPLVLFYREHQSIGTVALDLELTEDAVKQRLARGRKLLQEQFLAFVAGALEQTTPGKDFTLGVMAVLPILAGTGQAAAAGTTVTKGSGIAKMMGATGFLQTILKLLAPVGLFVSLGGWLGYAMGRDAAGASQRKRASVARFWGVITSALVLFVLLPILVWRPLGLFFASRETLLGVVRGGLDLLFLVLLAALAYWDWQRRKSQREEMAAAVAVKSPLLVWMVALAMIAAASFLALGLSDANWKVDQVSSADARNMILQNSDRSQYFVLQYQNGSRELWIKTASNGKVSKSVAPADASTLSLLTDRQIACPTYVQGRDFEIFGRQGKLLMGLFLLILPAGAGVLLTLCLKNKSTAPIMTKTTAIGIGATALLAALIVTPLVLVNHRKVNSVAPSRMTPQTLTPERAAPAKQLTQDFFAALAKSDWSEVDKLCPPGFSLSAQWDDQIKNQLSGLELVSLGEPFVKPPYPGVFVPYEIRFKNGESKKYNLAVRQDNPEQKWYFDGGL